MTTYTRIDKIPVTVTVSPNGDTKVDMGVGTLSFTGNSVAQATEFATFMNYNNAQLVEILDDSTMLVEFVKVVDLEDEARTYDFIRRFHGL